MKKLVIIFILALSAQSAEFYVSPLGSDANAGSFAAPWAITKICPTTNPSTANASVAPGDRVWIIGNAGAYALAGAHYCNLTGTAGSRIAVSTYGGDPQLTWSAMFSTNNALNVVGSYTDYIGLSPRWLGVKYETFGGSNPPRRVPSLLNVSAGIGANSAPTGNRIINFLILDGYGIVSATSSDVETTYYGIIGMSTGEDAPDRLHGGPVYAQNVSANGWENHDQNVFINNPFFYNWRVKTTDATKMDKFLLKDSIIIGGITQYYKEGDAASIDGAHILNNFIVGGFAFYGISSAKDLQVQDNLLVPSGISPPASESPSITGNTMVANGATGSIAFHRPNDTGTPIYETNHYYSSHSSGYCTTNPFSVTASFAAAWQALGYDVAGSCTKVAVGAGPAANTVKTYANAYESGRGHVAVYNWTGATTQAVDVSAILSVGDYYEITDLWNPLVVIATGTYAGGTISFPLTGTAIYTPAADYGATACWRTNCADCYTVFKSAASAGGLPAGTTLYEPGIITGTNAMYYWNGSTWTSAGTTCSPHAAASFVRDSKAFAFLVRRNQTYRASTQASFAPITNSATALVEWGYKSVAGTIAYNGPQQTVTCAVGAACSAAIPQAIGDAWFRVTWKDAGGNVIQTASGLKARAE